MLRKFLVLAAVALLATLAASSKAQAWGAYHVGYTHYGPATGFQHYGATAYRGGYGGSGRMRYGGAHYGAYGAGAYHYGGYHYGGYRGASAYRGGYYRRW